MRVLIISHTVWDNGNSFGNTFSNLFEGMPNVEIYNICCKHGQANNKVVKQAFQMTDKAVLRSIYKRNSRSGWVMDSQADKVMQSVNTELSEKAKRKRRTISFFLRDWIWKFGAWKKNKELHAFLRAAAPDVIYLPIYATRFMCDVQQYIVEQCHVPVVGHISDDVYGYSPKSSLLACLYKKSLRKKLRKLINKCDYLEVFAENMQKEYSRIFKKPCYLIGKGVNCNEIPTISYTYSQRETCHFVYTGNIGNERYQVLHAIGKALDSTSAQRRLVLDIYSATSITEPMRLAFADSPSIRFHGAITKDEVDQVQREADFLVHVESFSPQAIFSAKMSLSTKIIDYLSSGKPIFAVGPMEVNSIQLLKSKNLAVVATSEEDLGKLLAELLNEKIDISAISNSVDNYLREERDIKIIQSGMQARLNKVLEQKR